MPVILLAKLQPIITGVKGFPGQWWTTNSSTFSHHCKSAPKVAFG